MTALLIGIACAFVGLALGACLGLLAFLLLQLRAAVGTLDEAATRLAHLAALQAETWKETAAMVQEAQTTLQLIRNSAAAQANRRSYEKPSRKIREEEVPDEWRSPMDEYEEPEVGTEP
jgi:hypothetical protein